MTDLNTLVMPTKWTLEDALGLIRALQPKTRKWNYHLALGGGVLNNGFSEKDLDLYFLPMGSMRKSSDSKGLVAWLNEMWGQGEPIGQSVLRGWRTMTMTSDGRWVPDPTPDGGEYPAESPYTHKLKYKYGQQRIDVFVLGQEEKVQKSLDLESDENADDVVPAAEPGQVIQGAPGGSIRLGTPIYAASNLHNEWITRNFRDSDLRGYSDTARPIGGNRDE